MSQSYKLAEAKNFLSQREPFWPEAWLEEVQASGQVVMVPPMAELKEPLEISLQADQEQLIAIGDGAQVVIKEAGNSQAGSVRLFIGKDARVIYVADELTSRGVEMASNREAVLDQGAVINWYGATLNQENYKTRVRSWIRGTEGESNMHWLQFSSDSERVDLTLSNCFDAAQAKGQIFVKSAAADQAQVKLTGEIEITLDGGGTDSYLKEDTLLLDPKARIQALPCLEIKTNDVKAGHGATVTNFTMEDLFYLRSRGVEAATARQLMIVGFLESVLAGCPDQDFVARVRENLAI